MVSNGKKKHYTAIKSLSRLLSSENTRRKGKEYYCMNCLQGFYSVFSRNRHFEYCVDRDAVRVVMPSDNGKDNWLCYSSGDKQFKVPFIMYADFESILKPLKQLGVENNSNNSNNNNNTMKINEHVPCGLGYVK